MGECGSDINTNKLIRTATSLRLWNRNSSRNRINIFVTTNKNISIHIIYMIPLEIIIKIHSRAKPVRYINT
jgi:hypothetical protein